MSHSIKIKKGLSRRTYSNRPNEEHYSCWWTEKNGTKNYTSFSIDRYGDNLAYHLASASLDSKCRQDVHIRHAK